MAQRLSPQMQVQLWGHALGPMPQPRRSSGADQLAIRIPRITLPLGHLEASYVGGLGATAAAPAPVKPAVAPVGPATFNVTAAQLAAGKAAAQSFQTAYGQLHATATQAKAQNALEVSISAVHASLVQKGVDPKTAAAQALANPTIVSAAQKAGLFLGLQPPLPLIARAPETPAKTNLSSFWGLLGLGDDPTTPAQPTVVLPSFIANLIGLKDGQTFAGATVSVQQPLPKPQACAQMAQVQPSPYGKIWQNYCYCEYDDQDTIDACNKCPHDLFGNCISPPPWTEVGAAMRGIPKAHGSISAGAGLLAAVVNEIPSPTDYDPRKLAVLVWTDPIKYGILSTAAQYVPGIGIAYMSQFAIPGVGTPNPVGLAMAFALEGGNWTQAWNEIGQPILDAVGDKAGFVIDFFLQGAPVAVVKYAIKQLQKSIKDPKALGILAAIYSGADLVVGALRDPTRFKQAGIYVQLGSILTSAGNALITAGDPATGKWFNIVGGAIGGLAAPIVDLLNGNKTQALEDLSRAVLGAPWTVLNSKKPADRLTIIQASGNTTLLAALNPVAEFLGNMASTVKNIHLEQFAGEIGNIVNDFASVILTIQQAANADANTVQNATATQNAGNAQPQQPASIAPAQSTPAQPTTSLNPAVPTATQPTTVARPGLTAKGKTSVAVAGAAGAGLLAFFIAKAGVIAPALLLGLDQPARRRRRKRFRRTSGLMPRRDVR